MSPSLIFRSLRKNWFAHGLGAGILCVLALGIVEAATSDKPLDISSEAPLWIQSERSRIIRQDKGASILEWTEVHLKKGPYELRAAKLVATESTQQGTATGNVILRNPGENITIVGDKLVYNDFFKEVEVTGDPVLTKIDAEGRETRAQSIVMNFIMDEKRVIFLGQVKIRRGPLYTESDRAEYFVDQSVLVLTGNPVARQEDQIMEADKITIYVNENRVLMEGHVTGNIYGGGQL